MLPHREILIWTIVDFFSEIMGARRKCHSIFKVQKKKNTVNPEFDTNENILQEWRVKKRTK